VQAAKVGAMVVMDDPWGRKLARRHALDCHGTLWVLERLHALDLLSSSDVREHLRRITDQGIRLPRTTVNQLLRRLGESEL